MVENLHPKQQMDESPEADRCWEEGLLGTLAETVQELGTLRRLRDHASGAAGRRRFTGGEPGRAGGAGIQGGGPEDERKGDSADEEEKECMRRVLRALRELGVSHSDRVAAWREALREWPRVMGNTPPGGSDQQRPYTTDTECKVPPSSDSLGDTFISVEEDIKTLVDTLNTIITKLDKEILKLGAEETGDTTTSEQLDYTADHLNSSDPPCSGSGSKQDAEDGEDGSRASSSAEQASHPGSCNDVEEKGKQLVVKGEDSDNEDCVSQDNQTDFAEEAREKVEGNKEMSNGWITVGLTGQREDRHSDGLDACFIRAPPGVAEFLRCEVADGLSCLMVTGLEELVSRVIRVKVLEGACLHFPVTVVVPFCARYRGSYRDIAVKVVDDGGRTCYITPVATEGTYGGQRGSFAEVRVYALGLFAVIACLKRENYTVPTKGLSLKLPMDPRILLNYLPGSFTAPVMAQTMVQPMDAALLAAVKSTRDVYHSVVSTSPVLYLTHPSSQRLRKAIILTLPCPPNPEKKRHARGQGELPDHQSRPLNASPPWHQPGTHRRTLVCSVKSTEMPDELLIALGLRDKQWSVLDQVTVRNLQNGLVSFELTESFDRLLVVRLLSPLQPRHLTSLAEELEESACRHAVTIVLQRRQDEPGAALLAALPSRDLSWELSKLRAQGYAGLPHTCAQVSMCEGDQLLLRFCGNITSKGTGSDPREAEQHRLTFHSQLRSQLSLHLTEVDRFGNHSSPHYKGTAVFYKVARGQPEQMDSEPRGDPVCKLPLMLPKKARAIGRPVVARWKLHDETDSLSDSLLFWLSGELSEEEVALLVLSLRLGRSAAQLAKLRAGASPSAQAFHVLAMWRRGLPAAAQQPRASQLARCLARSGRPDLARELQLRQAAASRQGSLQPDSLKMTNHTAV